VIDFRYHLVSIVAVFLALAIGIVLGSTELQGSALDALTRTSNSLKTDLAAAYTERDNYQTQASAGAQFAQSSEAVLLNNLLAGRKILLITEPGAQGSVVSGIKQAATDAGATVTGQISLQPQFNDTSLSTQSNLQSLNATASKNDGISLVTSGNPSTLGQQQAIQLLAAGTLVTSATAVPALAQADAQTLINDYAAAGYLSVPQAPSGTATLAVVVTPQSPPSDGGSDPANQVLVAIAQQLATDSAATAVAGNTSGSGSGSAMSVLRSSSAGGQVSTIDDADTTIGQIATIQALAAQLAGGKPGSYGVDGATNGYSPDPAPTPAATATVTPATTPSPGATKHGDSKNKGKKK
jgi:hypothetical protein